MNKHLYILLGLFFAILIAGASSHIPEIALITNGINITPVLVGGTSFLGSIVNLAPSGALCNYAMISITKPKSNAGRPSPKKDHIIIFRWSGVPTPPLRDSKGILITEDLIINKSTTMSFYVTPSELSLKQVSEGDIDAKAWLQEIAASHPGDSLELDEFLDNNLNENLGLLVMPFDPSAHKRLCGAPEAPLQIDPESIDSKDGNKTTITFKSTIRGPRIARYTGKNPMLDSSEPEESGA